MTADWWRDFTERLLESSSEALYSQHVPHLSGISVDDWFPEIAAYALYWGMPARIRPRSIGHSVSLRIDESENAPDEIRITIWIARWQNDYERSRRQLTQIVWQDKSATPSEILNRAKEIPQGAVEAAMALTFDSAKFFPIDLGETFEVPRRVHRSLVPKMRLTS